MSDLMNAAAVKDTTTAVKAKETQPWFPGFVGIANERGHSPGCLFMEFKTADDANAYFKQTPGLLVVDIKYGPSGILVAYTKTMSEEEFNEMQEFTSKARELVDEAKAAREARTLEAEERGKEASKKLAEEKVAEEKELRRLAELGRRHEKNCARKAAKEEAK